MYRLDPYKQTVEKVYKLKRILPLVIVPPLFQSIYNLQSPTTHSKLTRKCHLG